MLVNYELLGSHSNSFRLQLTSNSHISCKIKIHYFKLLCELFENFPFRKNFH
ncbi:unnamed protein product [Tenebrio molitor]|nr:unnamed protein product [Tenebrio molitor]